MNFITYYGATHCGVVRTNNEDTFISQYLWDGRHLLCAAIDGLGGYEGGEVAAALARDTIVNYLQDNRVGKCLELLKQAVTEANNKIVERRQVDPGRDRMGCVITAGLFEVDAMRLNVVHVGDSRLYQWDDGNLRKLTHDHSLVGYREDNGELTEEQAMKHPQRNVVSRVVGERIHFLEDADFIEAFIVPVNVGMRFLFCTDGLSDMLTSAQIGEIIGEHNQLADCVQQLIEAACDHGGKDNVTVVMAQAEGEVPEARRAGSQGNDAPVKCDDENMEVETSHNDRRVGKLIACFAVFLLAALLMGYGGYRLGVSHESERVEALRLSADSSIVALSDSINHLNQVIYDQFVEIDSIKHR